MEGRRNINRICFAFAEAVEERAEPPPRFSPETVALTATIIARFGMGVSRIFTLQGPTDARTFSMMRKAIPLQIYEVGTRATRYNSSCEEG